MSSPKVNIAKKAKKATKTISPPKNSVYIFKLTLMGQPYKTCFVKIKKSLDLDFWKRLRSSLNSPVKTPNKAQFAAMPSLVYGMLDFDYNKIKCDLIIRYEDHIKEVMNWDNDKYGDFVSNGQVYLTSREENDEGGWLAPTLERWIEGVELDF